MSAPRVEIILIDIPEVTLQIIDISAAGPNDLCCDFCGVEGSTQDQVTVFQVVPHEVYTENGLVAQDIDGIWAACSGCAPLIQQNQKEALERRSLLMLLQRYFIPPASQVQVKKDISAVQQGFWKAMEWVKAKKEYDARN